MRIDIADKAAIRKARLGDVTEIQELVNDFAARDQMLPKSLSVLYENIRDFYVAEDSAGRVLGCCAVHVCWADLAEIKSLAVRDECQGMGLGSALVTACVEDCRSLDIDRVFALTYKVPFFEALGFRRVEKNTLPQKIWSECINCPKFPDCGEEAVVLDLGK
ncbi:MAG: N-acetyltransferase [Abditibacteriota bacterium]|nr:N-acetyltransferase [Abditibacteriota bacterium]